MANNLVAHHRIRYRGRTRVVSVADISCGDVNVRQESHHSRGLALDQAILVLIVKFADTVVPPVNHAQDARVNSHRTNAIHLRETVVGERLATSPLAAIYALQIFVDRWAQEPYILSPLLLNEIDCRIYVTVPD